MTTSFVTCSIELDCGDDERTNLIAQLRQRIEVALRDLGEAKLRGVWEDVELLGDDLVSEDLDDQLDPASLAIAANQEIFSPVPRAGEI